MMIENLIKIIKFVVEIFMIENLIKIIMFVVESTGTTERQA